MNGIKYLLDTNIIIGFYQRNSSILELLQTKQVKISECAYSSITRVELLSYPSITIIEQQTIEFLLTQMNYLSISRSIENQAIEFRRIHQTKLPDSIIAATAKYHKLELLTLDKKLASKL
jgi:predicted nucleic acid-binding protein